MDYFMQFHWWYIPVGFVVCFIVFGKGKGGFVVTRLTANMEILDQRFTGCRPEAKYSTFKEGRPDHIEIEVDRLSLPAGEELAIEINGETLAKVKVKSNKEAEFDHWSDEDVDFPVIKEGDELVIRYQGADALKGTFQ